MTLHTKRERTCRKCGQRYRGRHCKNRNCVNFKTGREATRRAARRRPSRSVSTGSASGWGRALASSSPGDVAMSLAPTLALPHATPQSGARAAGEGATLDEMAERLTYLTERHEQFTGSDATRWSPYRDELIRVMDRLECELAGVEL